MTATKSWISYSDCQGAHDKQLTQYLLIPRKMEDAPKLLKILNSEYPDTWIRLPRHTWLNRGPAWNTQSFLLIEIFMVILLQVYYVKGNMRKSYCSTVGRKFPLGNAYSHSENY